MSGLSLFGSSSPMSLPLSDASSPIRLPPSEASSPIGHPQAAGGLFASPIAPPSSEQRSLSSSWVLDSFNPNVDAAAAFEAQKLRIRQAAAQESERLREHFEGTDPRHFAYEGLISNGASGFACRFIEKSRFFRLFRSNRRARRFAVKRPLPENVQPGAAQGVQRELQWLQELKGAEHIVQLARTRRRSPLDSLDGPTLIMEWLPNGTLGQFIRRARNWSVELPNQVHLRLFLCLTRMCIAMAYPPRETRNGVVTRERIPEDPILREARYQLRHADMHNNNVLIGDLDVTEFEHALVPPLKLIDFDRAEIQDDPDIPHAGNKGNIRDIGFVMYTVITRSDEFAPPPGPVTINIRGREETFQSYGANLVSDRANRCPNLDRALGDLVAWCLATDYAVTPTLDELWAALRDLIRSRDPYSYDNDAANYPARGYWERPRRIQFLLKGLIFEASTDPGQP
ncbi:hypothetical protein F4778DRAFT_763842 [Xylariomycetidae sp. FL2044]|nr:hypothetical protein F4778DRAFT_763842 [Xylariomycetidae sp. FL2044]